MREDEFLKNGKSAWIQYIADKLFDRERYYVYSPWCQRIGHLVYEILAAACVAQRDNKKLVLIPHYNPVNKEIFNCNFSCEFISRKDIRVLTLHVLLIISGFCNWLYNGCRNRAGKYIPILSKVLPKIFFYPRIGIEKGRWWRHRLRDTEYYFDYDLLMSQEIKVNLNPEQHRKGNEIKERLGLPKDAWFVCLHVRDQGYLGLYPHHNHRDSNILNYMPAIEYIIDQGGYVVRMGDLTMTPLPKMRGVIDYALSEYRSGLMDLYLVSECRFFLGCDSGPLAMAWIFNRPLLSVNFSDPNINVFYKDNDVIVPKHVFSIEKNRILSFKELISSDIYTEDMPNSRFVFIENEPEEILDAVRDYIKFLDNKMNDWNTSLQASIRATIRSRHEDLLSQDSIDGGKKECWGGTLNNKGMIGKSYLENCWEYGPYLEELTLEFKEKENS